MGAVRSQAVGTTVVTRIRALENELARERMLRLKSQQEASGLRSACLRLKALLAQKRADEAKARISEIASA
jgi:hypothetical protein